MTMKVIPLFNQVLGLRSNKTLVYYPGTTLDGRVSAWVLERMQAEQLHFRSWDFSKPLEPAFGEMKGNVVYLVGLSPNEVILNKIAKIASELVVIDNKNVDVIEKFIELNEEKVSIVTGRNISVAKLCWKHFNEGTDTPKILDYIDDHYVGTNRFTETKNIIIAMKSYEEQTLTLDTFFDFMDTLVDPETGFTTISKLMDEGFHIQRYHQNIVRSLIPAIVPTTNISGYDVPCVNAPIQFASDLGNILAKGQPFAAVYSDSNGERRYELRSHEDGVDVGEIAREFGGGGRPRTAGFVVKKNHASL